MLCMWACVLFGLIIIYMKPNKPFSVNTFFETFLCVNQQTMFHIPFAVCFTHNHVY